MARREDEPTRFPATFEVRMTLEMRDEILPELASEFDMSKSAFIRWLIREYQAGKLLHLTKAFKLFTDSIVESGAHGLALIAAEAERTYMESDRWRGKR